MSVLVDTSMWIDYFRGGKDPAQMDFFIDENILVTNDLVLTELIPILFSLLILTITSKLHGICIPWVNLPMPVKGYYELLQCLFLLKIRQQAVSI